MEYNECANCGANEGRAGMLIGNNSIEKSDFCLNCNDTRETGEVVIHANLIRTEEEIAKTISLVEECT